MTSHEPKGPAGDEAASGCRGATEALRALRCGVPLAWNTDARARVAHKGLRGSVRPVDHGAGVLWTSLAPADRSTALLSCGSSSAAAEHLNY